MEPYYGINGFVATNSFILFDNWRSSYANTFSSILNVHGIEPVDVFDLNSDIRERFDLIWDNRLDFNPYGDFDGDYGTYEFEKAMIYFGTKSL